MRIPAEADDEPGPFNLENQLLDRAAEYQPPSVAESRHKLAIAIITGFISSVLLTLLFVLYSVVKNTYRPEYLTILTAVGSIWGGLTGAVVGFFFSRGESNNTDEE